MDILSLVGNSIDFIEPAYVIVHDARNISTTTYDRQQKFGTTFNFNPKMVAGDLTKLKNAQEALAGNLNNGGNNTNKRFRVQFNPSELSLRAYNSEVVASNRNMYSKLEQISSSNNTGYIELDLNLFFDKMKPATAFGLEKGLNPGASLVTGGAAIIKNAMGKKETVAKEVEGFTAAVRNPKTRYISFVWQDFVFSGSVVSMNAEYMMFDLDGDPVRATVMLRIRMYAQEFAMDEWVGEVSKNLAKAQAGFFEKMLTGF